MVWFNVDDTLAFHRKTIQAGNAAMGLWTRAGSWCCSTLTDGFVPRAIARSLGTIGQCKALVNAGLWIEVEGGYRFHEWEQRQQTKADVEAKREADRIRKADQRKRRNVTTGQTEDVQTDSVTDASLESVTESDPESQEDSILESAPPIPSIPFPSSLVPNGTKEREPRKRGTRLKADWMPAPETIAWSKSEHPTLNHKQAHEKFMNYWQAKTGRDATKLDWDLTWRNWIIRESESAAPRSNKVTPTDRAQAVREMTDRLSQQPQAQENS